MLRWWVGMDKRALSLALRISRDVGTGIVWVKAGLLDLLVHVSGIRTSIWWGKRERKREREGERERVREKEREREKEKEKERERENVIAVFNVLRVAFLVLDLASLVISFHVGPVGVAFFVLGLRVQLSKYIQNVLDTIIHNHDTIIQIQQTFANALQRTFDKPKHVHHVTQIGLSLCLGGHVRHLA